MIMYGIYNQKIAPTELTIMSSKVFEDMNGHPYQAYIMQFKRAYVMMSGATDLLLSTLMLY